MDRTTKRFNESNFAERMAQGAVASRDHEKGNRPRDVQYTGFRNLSGLQRERSRSCENNKIPGVPCPSRSSLSPSCAPPRACGVRADNILITMPFICSGLTPSSSPALTIAGEVVGGRSGRLYTYRYTVTTRMTSALTWAVMRAILMFQ